MQSKQWKHHGLPPPNTFKRVHSAEKMIASIFWYHYIKDIKGWSLSWSRLHDKRCILWRQIEAATPGNHTKGARKTDSRCSVLAGQRPCPHVTSCYDCCDWMWIWNPSTSPYSPDMACSYIYICSKNWNPIFVVHSMEAMKSSYSSKRVLVGPEKGILIWRDVKARTEMG